MSELNELMEKYRIIGDKISQLDFKLWIVVACVILLFIGEMVVLYKGCLTFETRNSKQCKKASELGHVVQARLVDGTSSYRTIDDDSILLTARYKYTVRNNSYKYHYVDRRIPPHTLTLYYINNPKNTFHAKNKTWEPGFLLYILPLVLGLILMQLLGVNY